MLYQVVTGEDLPLFEHMIYDLLSQGWQCQGGVSMSQTTRWVRSPNDIMDIEETVFFYAQAMTKEEKFHNPVSGS